MVDSRASVHLVSKRDLISAELGTMRTSRSPTTVMTANGEVQTREEATENVKELDIFVTVVLLQKKQPQFFHSESSADTRITGPTVKKPHLTKKGKRIDCNFSNYVPCVVPGLSTSSSPTPPPTSSSSSSQDSVFDISSYTENPVAERSGSTSKELQGNPMHKTTETENKNKYEGREEVQSDLLHDLLDWLQDFRENLVDESGPSEPRETLLLMIETLPVLLVNYQWSREQKWNRVRVSIVSTRTFRRTQIAISG